MAILRLALLALATFPQFVGTVGTFTRAVTTLEVSCPFPTARQWLAYCVTEDDCTGEDHFCACCADHALGTAWGEACGAICAHLPPPPPPPPGGFEFAEFSDATEPRSARGPYFEQPGLSLVGDAAVVLGDCYNMHVRATVRDDNSLHSCLVPPFPERLFPTDPRLPVNLSVCGTRRAPFHLETAVATAPFLCFDECHAAPWAEPPAPLPSIDHGALFLANCSRACFTSCASARAAECTAGCASTNYSCYEGCHAAASRCSVPRGIRDTTTFRVDPDAPQCETLEVAYRECVGGCGGRCHAALAASLRTLQDDIDDWYVDECVPRLEASAEAAVTCLERCHGNCSCVDPRDGYMPPEFTVGGGIQEGRWVEGVWVEGGEVLVGTWVEGYGSMGEVLDRGRVGAGALFNCTLNCSATCAAECLAPSILDEYGAPCSPPPVYNCTDECFGGTCTQLAHFCTAHAVGDANGNIQSLDLNCTHNASLSTVWNNVTVRDQLDNPSSPLSQLLGINVSLGIVCYSECDNATVGAWGAAAVAWPDRFAEVAGVDYGAHCRHHCYYGSCMDECLANCTVIDAAAARPLCVVCQTADPDEKCDCGHIHADPEANRANCTKVPTERGGNTDGCAYVETRRADGSIRYAPPVNVTALVGNATAAEVYVPPWDAGVCRGVAAHMTLSTLESCLGGCRPNCTSHCDGWWNWTVATGQGRIDGVNDTSGVCMHSCLANCSVACATPLASGAAVDAACLPPERPEDLCVPPPNCTHDCADECLDPSYLVAQFPDCIANKTILGPNGTVVSLHYAYNVSNPPSCARNFTGNGSVDVEGAPDGCPREHLYFNVTEWAGDVLFYPECVERCYGRCTQRCFDRYCVTNMEEPHEDEATCVPRCLQRFVEPRFVPPPPPLPNATANLTRCLIGCEGRCLEAAAANCSAACDALRNPANFSRCTGACIAAEARVCEPFCVLNCTQNHTLAYGGPSAEVVAAAAEARRRGELVDAELATYDGRAEYLPSRYWAQHANSSLAVYHSACYGNCSLDCARDCFVAVVGECVPEGGALDQRCVERQKGACGDACDAECAADCANRTAVAKAEREAVEEAALVDYYVASCEDKCRTQIYGNNVTDEQRCLVFHPGYHAECIANCTAEATIACTLVNQSIDIAASCNTSCFSLRPKDVVTGGGGGGDAGGDAGGGANASSYSYGGGADGADAAADGGADAARGDAATPADTGAAVVDGVVFDPFTGLSATQSYQRAMAAYDTCVDYCERNFTADGSYACDGGDTRRVALEALSEARQDAELDTSPGGSGVDPREQMEIERLSAAVPMGELCYPVQMDCLYNASLVCDDVCAEQVAYYQALCFKKEDRNASFDYNISSCQQEHPDWPGHPFMIGQSKREWARSWNTSNPMQHPMSRVKKYKKWSYDDVDHLSVLNCSCHFLNQTWDPDFVAAMLLWQMRPLRNHYVTTCLCLFNETSGLPQDCAHHNFTRSEEEIWSWVFGNASAAVAAPVDYPVMLTENFDACAAPILPLCYDECDAHFLRQQRNYDGSGKYINTTYVKWANATGSRWWGPGLRGYVDDRHDPPWTARGLWRADHACLIGCMHQKVGRCAAACDAACGPAGHMSSNFSQNETARGFVCEAHLAGGYDYLVERELYDDAIALGEPRCEENCDCHRACGAGCAEAALGQKEHGVNSSALAIEYYPSCLENCTSRCLPTHHEVCHNYTEMLIAAARPPDVNDTAVCLASIGRTCSWHCLGISTFNTSVNNSLFPARLLAPELRTLVHDGTAERYDCKIERCLPDAIGEKGDDDFDPGLTYEGAPCWNRTIFEVDRVQVVDEASGNVSWVPVLWNVTGHSLSSCRTNRSSTCLARCGEIGYKICVPDTDPFDLCVQSCVANLTYEPPPPRFDHSLAMCKKQLRLTPAESERVGAAWYREKKVVRHGFATSFHFKMDRQSRTCQGPDGGDHATRPESHEALCQIRGGDGFAFVIQDAGHTALDPECALGCVQNCLANETAVCFELCRSQCAPRVHAAGAACARTCAAGLPYAGAPDGLANIDAGSGLANIGAAGDSCEAYVRECVPACDEEPDAIWSGAAMEAGGCLRACVEAGSRVYCEARCPLVDEDVDDECVRRCAVARLSRSFACVVRCNETCAVAAAAEGAHCGEACATDKESTLPGGGTVGSCEAGATAHPAHESALCLTGCNHDDVPCLANCSMEPPHAVENCFASCEQNNTACAADCLARRRRVGRACILPCATSACAHSSTALGAGANGVGYATLHNTVAVKFDTWYNPYALEPYNNHIAVHSGGTFAGAPDIATQALGLAVDIPDLADGEYHEARIEYVPRFEVAKGEQLSTMPRVGAFLTPNERGGLRYLGVLRVFLDGMRVLTVPVNLEEAMTLDGGRAFVGFTAATGGAYQEHKLANWVWMPDAVGTPHPPNLHCRNRVPSLIDGRHDAPDDSALACTPGVIDTRTPVGAVHSVVCTDGADGDIRCADPNRPNEAPVLKHDPMPNVHVLARKPFAHEVAADAFVDVQPDGSMTSDLLTYSVAAVAVATTTGDRAVAADAQPEWLAFDARTRVLSGTPPAAGTWTLNLTATDPGFREGKDPPMATSTTFTLHVDETEAKPDEHSEVLHDGGWNAMENTHMRTEKMAVRPSDTRTHVYRYVEPGSATTGDVVFPE